MKKGLLTLLAAALTIDAQDLDTIIPNTPVGSAPCVSQTSDGIGLETLFKLLVKAE